MRKEIRVSGFGGQGVILSGYIIGKAASIYDGKNASFTQSYGPEARGGACAAQVVISDSNVDFPLVRDSEVLISLSQVAYNKFRTLVKPNGVVLTDEDLVKPENEENDIKTYAIPATRIAEELGNKIVGNIVMLGYMTKVTGIVSKEAMMKSIGDSVPERFKELNIEAFEKGYQYPG
ncbi:2-oxoacid:acceptor oxidoreductase family protein [bacterium]|nr:2-oxoacid:acceptor oxidoreductase family protein [bacterium]